MRRIAARRFLAPAAAALALAVAGCDSGSDPEQQKPPPPRPISERGLVRDLAELDAIARRHGGERAIGTPGYAASVDFVVAELRRAGWRVRRERVQASVWRERGPGRMTVAGRELRPGRDFRAPSFAAGGNVTGTLRAVDDGCQAADFDGLASGDVAFTGFGTCFLWRKTLAAKRAGAAAVVAQTTTSGRGVPSATLVVPGIGLPVVLMAADVPARDGDQISLALDAGSRPGRTENVIAELGPRTGPVTMAGAHLDSVPGGPGINDNGSGVATLLEVARSFGGRPPGRVRLAFWAAEEEGLVGSRAYVRSLSPAQRREIRAYLNLDMVGSPNAVPAVYSDGDRDLARLLRRVHPGRERGVLTGNRSDHSPFESAGVPVNGLYTGANEPGPEGRHRDPCYHLPCDTLRNVDLDVLLPMARATARALERLARR